MTDETNALPMGFSLHRYQIESILGAGGFGITYRALHEALQNQVAIKEYFPAEWSYRDHDGTTVRPNAQGQIPARSGEPACYDWGLQRFLDEAKILVQINHPCVVRVRDYFTANGSAYIVMEYEAGESLSMMLQRGGILPEQELRNLLDDVVPALTAVHAQGYLHRDLKPSNLYIRASDGRVMLIDFGAARQALGRRTRSVTSVVTPGYSPIEQYVTVGEDYGPWTDIYALGAVLYRCITGAPPIEAPGRVLKDPVQPAVECGAGLYSTGLLRVVDQALAVRPEDRFQTVAALRDALRMADQSGDRMDFSQAPQLRPELLNPILLDDDLHIDISVPNFQQQPAAPGDSKPWNGFGRNERQSKPSQFNPIGKVPVSPRPFSTGIEKISLPSERQSGWTLADFDTQNPDSVPVTPSPPFSAPEKKEPSLSIPFVEDTWAQDTTSVQPATPTQTSSGPASSMDSNPAGGLSVLNRPSGSALDHLRKISATKVDLGSVHTRSTALEKSTPVSRSTEIRRQSDYEARSFSQPSTLNSEADAIAYGDTATGKGKGIHWKWIIITVCIVTGLIGAGLLGYEYFKIAQEQQRREEAKKQQEQQAIARLTEEENRRREADIAERIQKIRDDIANKRVLAAELSLERMAEAYPDHPALATLRTEMATAEEQGVSAKTQTETKTGIKLVWIPPGCFNMGSSSTEQDRSNDESSHQTCVKGFWIGATEVTNGQYRRYKPDHDSGSFQGRPLNQDTQPVVNVNWTAAKAFTEWLSWEAGSGKRFRLPTEAEWEYAARANATTRYFWGNTIDPRYANFSDRNDPSGASLKTLDDGQAVTAPVGRYLANSFGLRDMSGNAWEWTCSEYDPKYGGQEQGCSDKGPSEGQRVARGGSWNNGAGDLRSAKRLPRKPEQADSYTGFRVLMEE